MKIVDLADQIYRNLSSPEDISIASISAYLRFGVNLGKLNSLLGSNYSVQDSTLEIVDQDGVNIGINEAAVYEVLYQINYYSRQTNRFLGAGGVDVNFLQEASSDNGTLRFTSRNEVAKSFIQIRKDLDQQLDKLINYYKFNRYRPQSVDGDDTVVGQESLRIPGQSIENTNDGFLR